MNAKTRSRIPSRSDQLVLMLVTSVFFRFSLYSAIILLSLIRAGNAPIESGRSKLTLYLMASFIFADSLSMLYREFRQQSNIAHDDQ